MEPRPFGVTVLGGFLGAGKTTLLARILRDPGGRRLGVLVNDFGDLPVDAALVSELTDEVMRLSNGCVCCSMANDLMRALMAMKDGGQVDHAIIETSGVADTEALTGALMELENSGVLWLDAVVTLVDAEAFPRTLADHDALGRAQVRAADLVVINKIDLVDDERAAAVEAQVRSIAPRARVVRTTDAELPLDVVVGADERAPRPASSPHEHHDRADTFSAWTFTEARPLSWMVLGPLLASLPEGVFRAKGTLQLVERPGARVLLQVVGRRVHVRTVEASPGEAPSSAIVLIGTRAEALRAELEEKLREAVVRE